MTSPALSDAQKDRICDLLDSDVWADERIAAWEKQMDREGGVEIYTLETAEEKVNALTARISKLEMIWEDAFKNDVDYFERSLFLEFSGYKRDLKARTAQQRLVWQTQPKEGWITEEDIERARNVPLESLVELNREKKTLCIFHPDKKPSMYVAKGFGHCFSCNAWADSIKWWMKKNGRSFVDAVRALGHL